METASKGCSSPYLIVKARQARTREDLASLQRRKPTAEPMLHMITA